MRTSFHHQSEAQPPNGPLTAATSADTEWSCKGRRAVAGKAVMTVDSQGRDVLPSGRHTPGSWGRFLFFRRAPPPMRHTADNRPSALVHCATWPSSA